MSIQSIQKNPSLTFEGTTAVCYAIVTSGNLSDAITVNISLWCGDSLMGSWSGSGSGRATAYGECSAVSGQTYKLILNSTINGVLDAYIKWYNEERIKTSLGGMSPIQYRHSLGLIA